MGTFEARALSDFLGSLPTLLAVILAWIYLGIRISETARREADVTRDLTQQLQEMRELLRSEILRVEEVVDSRLRRLEES